MFMLSSKRSLPLVVLLFLWDVGEVPSWPAKFTCSDELSSTCDTYVASRAREPDYVDVGSISDLFGVSRISIVKASNLVSEEDRLSSGRIVLAPIKCGCGGNNYSIANVTYEMKKGESYYQVSMNPFENLTDWHLAEEANPSLSPSLLPSGAKVVFPVYCKCLSRSLQDEGLDYLVTYVWENSNTVRSVAGTFNASLDIILRKNTDLFNLDDIAGQHAQSSMSEVVFSLSVLAQSFSRLTEPSSIISAEVEEAVDVLPVTPR